MSSTHSNQNAWVAFGRLGRAKGLRGQIYLDTFNPDSELLSALTDVGVGVDETSIRTAKIARIHRSSSRWVVSLDLAGTREEAESLTHQTVFVRRADFPALPEGQFYHFEILGFAVKTVDGEALGHLKEILSTASNEIYVVDGPDGEIDLPNLPEVVLKIDASTRTVTVRVPETLDAL